EDLPRGRFYLTEADCQRFGITRQDLQAAQVTPAMHQLLADSSAWAAALIITEKNGGAGAIREICDGLVETRANLKKDDASEA
ncbi:MAG: hypothetical protein COC02_07860, partial [Rhodospirillaceae bacterium]